MKKDIEQYVLSCDQCQQYKVTRQKPPGLMKSYHVPAPGNTLSLDLVGPLPATPNQNTQWLQWWKWLEVFPLRRAATDRII